MPQAATAMTGSVQMCATIMQPAVLLFTSEDSAADLTHRQIRGWIACTERKQGLSEQSTGLVPLMVTIISSQQTQLKTGSIRHGASGVIKAGRAG